MILNEPVSALQKIDNDLLNKRKICFVLNCTDKKITHMEGQNALTVARQFFNVADIQQNIIQGVVASVGNKRHFRGTARIVLTIDQIGKVKEGDILVTTMTSPDFVIGIKKAAAIITDVGGMLSHAAIVSRELKKPCIVGTEIATKVIHDGDIVELHSGKGIVKIIKS
ncbi:hypothetical protein A2Y99_04850 [Candidatus Gottesmanbacteria bacterium RBG_13_37_7]|uniref:PEP-utilising enzyme mobile domain-containing protein n=1 Tax=Candidatus Gottesmanbacteria bacterium RBG_13_37_7 TaxID=1798369 RepID=A0A1F5YJ67_9BACT|nr:MAG: hypothetical protein A2Y99_04850 [Candidatus Gottesmanbacteria bacterium RBG_13_37_7]